MKYVFIQELIYSYSIWDEYCLLRFSEPVRSLPYLLCFFLLQIAHRDRPLFVAIVRSAPRLLPRMDPLEVSQISWALATLNFTSDRLLQLISELVVAQLEASRVDGKDGGKTSATQGDDNSSYWGFSAGRKEWTMSSLSNVAWAFAVMKPGETRLLSAVFSRAGFLLSRSLPLNQAQQLDNSAEVRSMRQVITGSDATHGVMISHI